MRMHPTILCHAVRWMFRIRISMEYDDVIATTLLSGISPSIHTVTVDITANKNGALVKQYETAHYELYFDAFYVLRIRAVSSVQKKQD